MNLKLKSDRIRIEYSRVVLLHLISYVCGMYILPFCVNVFLICLFLYTHNHSYVLYSIAHFSV